MLREIAAAFELAALIYVNLRLELQIEGGEQLFPKVVGWVRREFRADPARGCRSASDRFRRISLAAVHPIDGPLTKATADIDPRRREGVFMPQSSHMTMSKSSQIRATPNTYSWVCVSQSADPFPKPGFLVEPVQLEAAEIAARCPIHRITPRRSSTRRAGAFLTGCRRQPTA